MTGLTPADVTVLAHGVGGRQDLPVPFFYALAAAVVVLVVSFAALGLLWRRPRFAGDGAGRPLPVGLQCALDSRAFRAVLRAAGLAVAGYVAFAAVAGPDLATNPSIGAVYVLFWVGIVPVSLLFGPVWRLLNPLRTLHRGVAAVMRVPPETGLWQLPARLGYWPAAAGLYAFTWLELVAPDRATTTAIKIFFAFYIAANLLAAAAFGARWFDRGDSFEVYSTLIGRLAPVGRRADGRLVLRNPLDGLDGIKPAPGLAAVVCVLLGSTAFDGLSNAPVWVRATQEGALSSMPILASGTLGLTAAVLLVGLAYTLAVLATGRVTALPRVALPGMFAHTIVPIAIGYVVAHYFSLLVFEGQRTLILASDPLSNGANLFGTAERGVDLTLVSPATIAAVQVLAVVTGHVIGVVTAHDRAVRLFPRRQAVAGQLPLLVLMVGYTLTGLTLLFAA